MKSRKSILDFDLKRNKLLSITSQSAVDVRENNLQISTVTKSVRKESVESLVSIKMTPKNFTKKQLKVDDYRDEKTSIKSNTSINKKEFIETDEKTLKIPGTFEDIKLFKNLPNKRLLSVTIDNDEIISIKSESSFTKRAQENKKRSNESNESSVSSTESVESLKRRNPICLKVKNRDEAISVKTIKTINRNNSTDSNETPDFNMGNVRKYKKTSKVLKEEYVSSNDTEESLGPDSRSSAKSESEESNQSVKMCKKATICTLEDSQTNSIKPVNYLFNKKHSKYDEDNDSNATENDQDSVQTVDESNEEEEQTNDKSSNESADEKTSIESVNTNEYSASKDETKQNDSHEYAESTKSIEKEYEPSPSNSDDSVTESNISENDYEDEEDEKSQSEKEKTSESEDDESEDEDSNEEGEEPEDEDESEENEDESSNEEEVESEDEDESESKEEETEEDDESEEQSDDDDEDEDMHEEKINYKKVKTRKSITSIKSVKFSTKNQIHAIPRLKH